MAVLTSVTEEGKSIKGRRLIELSYGLASARLSDDDGKEPETVACFTVKQGDEQVLLMLPHEVSAMAQAAVEYMISAPKAQEELEKKAAKKKDIN